MKTRPPYKGGVVGKGPSVAILYSTTKLMLVSTEI